MTAAGGRLDLSCGPGDSAAAGSAPPPETLRQTHPELRLLAPAAPPLMDGCHLSAPQSVARLQQEMATAGHARFFTASSPWPEQLAGHLPPAAAHAPDWALVARGIANGDPAGGCSPARSYSTPDAVRSLAPKPNASDDAAWAEGDSLTDGEATSDSGGTSDSYDDDDGGGEGGSGMQNGGSAQRMRTRSGDRPRRPPPPPVGKRKLGRPIMFTGDPDDPTLSKDERRRIRRRAANRASAQRVRERRMQQTSLTMIQLQETEARRDALQSALEAAQADLRQLAAALQQASQRWHAACTKTQRLQARLGSAGKLPPAALPYPEPLPLQGGPAPLQGCPPVLQAANGWQPAPCTQPPLPVAPPGRVAHRDVLTPGMW